jgi:hypothetical protein
MARESHLKFEGFLILLLTVPSAGNGIHFRKCRLSRFLDGSLREAKMRPSRIKHVGTFQGPFPTNSGMSWSPDGSHLAINTGQNVSVWRLPLSFTSRPADTSSPGGPIKVETTNETTKVVCTFQHRSRRLIHCSGHSIDFRAMLTGKNICNGIHA